MKFSLEIGDVEKHRVDCETNPFWAMCIIKVDDVEKAKVRHVFFGPRCESHSFEVGKAERLHVTVENIRRLFARETHRVFVNGRLIKCFSEKEATDSMPKGAELAA
ncbi:MAG: hypothetical protein JWM68_4632 [Verrucomicrobiales bacterium]|nr:hypothetical protein [Verrucomicrobiales bacterium]